MIPIFFVVPAAETSPSGVRGTQAVLTIQAYWYWEINAEDGVPTERKESIHLIMNNEKLLQKKKGTRERRAEGLEGSDRLLLLLWIFHKFTSYKQ